MKRHKIYFPVPPSGSGVETSGKVFMSMLHDYVRKYPSRVYFDFEQKPPYAVAQKLAEFKPTVIILNEIYGRLFRVAYHYKVYHPDTKIILLNHAFQNLREVPHNPERWQTDYDYDCRLTMDQLLMNGIDHIINLNYRPPWATYSPCVSDKVIDQLFPIPDRFERKSEWKERPNDFFFYGGIHPVKFSEEFINKILTTDLKIDLYGKWIEKEIPGYLGYVQKIRDTPNINICGWIPDEKLVDTINAYRFYVVPHSGPEPFMLTLAEAIRCGTIPLVVNNRHDPFPEWIDWAKDCYVEYQTVDDLIEKMQYYSEHRSDGRLAKILNERSTEISEEMKKRTDYNNFKEMFLRLIFSE